MDSPSHLEVSGRFGKEGKGYLDWEFGSTEGLADGKGCGQCRKGQSRGGKTSWEATSLASYCNNPCREREQAGVRLQTGQRKATRAGPCAQLLTAGKASRFHKAARRALGQSHL